MVTPASQFSRHGIGEVTVSQRCVVVGAGVLGAALAVELAAAGTAVTVFDAGQPAGGATGSTFAWIGASHPGLSLSAEYLQLNLRGVAAHRRWAQLWGDRGWFRRTGALTWHTDATAQEHMADHVQELRAMSYPAEMLNPRRAVDRLEPALRVAPSVDAVAWFPDEGYALGRPMVGDMLSVAASLGAEIRTGCEITGLRHAQNRVVGVDLADGGSVDADFVVLACGSRTPTMLDLAGASPVPVVSPEGDGSLAVGMLVITSPLPRPLTRVVVADELMMRPDGGGRLMLHRDAEDRLILATTPIAPPPDAARELLRAAGTYIDGTMMAAVESTRIGIRPVATDFLPVLGWAGGVEGVYMLLTHSGVTLAAAVAEMAAAEITGGPDQPLFTPFRPQRFT